MLLLRVFPFLPSLLLAAQLSGTVKDLAGAPLAGVAVSAGGANTFSDAQGRWSLGGGTTGIAPHAGTVPSRGGRVLATQGALRLSWNGAGIQGRRAGMAVEAVPGASVAPRVAVAQDTIVAAWNGKRLVRLPVTGDSSGLELVIDTAWSDDQGVPWNPLIAYGSMLDSLGRTYRTVKIGSQVWMAENLNFGGANGVTGVCVNRASGRDSCRKYGRLYVWNEAMGFQPSSNALPSGVQGICPVGWHLPSDTEWTILDRFVDPQDSQVGGGKLKSRNGWPPFGTASGSGTDEFGFRGLPGGESSGMTGSFFGTDGVWWSSTEEYSPYGKYFALTYSDPKNYFFREGKATGFSIRCLKD